MMTPHYQASESDRVRFESKTQIDHDFLAAIAAHELREPVQAIMSFISVVLQGVAGPLTDVQFDFLSTAGVATRRLKRRIDDLQLVLAGEVGLKLNLQPVDLARHVTSCVQELSEIARSYNVTIETQFQCTSGAGIIADPDRVDQIILNLVENAIQYASTDSTVTVGLNQSEGGAWCLTVQNNVDEVPEAEPDAWFTPFDRGFSVQSAQQSGTGLGLTAVEYLVRAQGGQVMAQTRGNRVYFGVIFGREDKCRVASV